MSEPTEADDREPFWWQRPMTAEDAIEIHQIVHGEAMPAADQELLRSTVTFSEAER